MESWIRKSDSQTHLREEEKNGVTFLTFPALTAGGLVSHAFSTRMGGVSLGPYATMNFSFTRGDDPKHVLENYRRMAGALEVSLDRMVLTWQTHTTNIRIVSEEDFGKGVVKERDYRDVDGLLTDIPGVTLVTFFADCVPLYFLDPVHRAIGLAHSGWKGTKNRMGAHMVHKMEQVYHTDPKDLICCIGPSICKNCYEVGEDVAAAFRDSFSYEEYRKFFLPSRTGSLGKFQLDLWEANRQILLQAGVKKEHISVTDICTRCNPYLLFSHRAMGEKRGNSCAFLSLKEGKEKLWE